LALVVDEKEWIAVQGVLGDFGKIRFVLTTYQVASLDRRAIVVRVVDWICRSQLCLYLRLNRIHVPWLHRQMMDCVQRSVLSSL
jgi:hypothetical protein